MGTSSWDHHDSYMILTFELRVFCIFLSQLYFLPLNVALSYLYMNQHNLNVMSHICPCTNSHTIVFRHIWEPSLDLYQVSSPTDLKSKINLYITKTNSMTDYRISVHSYSMTYIINLNVPCFAMLYFLFYICCHGFICMPALIFNTDDLHK